MKIIDLSKNAVGNQEPKAVHLQAVARSPHFDVKNVKVEYQWCPGIEDVFIGPAIKTSYSHSLWVGVVMTAVNLPQLLWRLLLKPIGGALFIFTVIVFGRLMGGIMGQASGIKVDAESFGKESARSMFKMFGVDPAILEKSIAEATESPVVAEAETPAAPVATPDDKPAA